MLFEGSVIAIRNRQSDPVIQIEREGGNRIVPTIRLVDKFARQYRHYSATQFASGCRPCAFATIINGTVAAGSPGRDVILADRAKTTRSSQGTRE